MTDPPSCRTVGRRQSRSYACAGAFQTYTRPVVEKMNIDGLCCSEKFLSLGSGSEGKREIVLNGRPELYRGKYRCVQPKINLLKRRSYACETMCFPVEPSGCRRGAST
ncbi:hypothetical protein TNCV_4996631 [Trichonephila clavipes]|nr:hypothetical protein TNCV_4996631 [Trichonephila clavipes]